MASTRYGDQPAPQGAGEAGGADGSGPDGGGATGRSRPSRPWLPVAFVVLVALLLGALVGGVLLARSGDGPSADPAPAGTSSPAPTDADAPGRLTRAEWTATEVGVFRRTEPAEVTAYEEWLGRPVDLAVDFSSRDDWYNIAAPEYLVEAWQDADQRLVLGVAMLPSEIDGVSMGAGADGEYDQYFRDLGQLLVDSGQQDAVLRIGWEMNLDSWVWSTDDEEEYIAYWRRIVEQFESVPGAEFRYDWTVNNGGGGPYDAVDYYPGDDVVDYVGVDAYDVSGGRGHYPVPEDCTGTCAQERRDSAWDERIYGGDRGLRFWSDFAREHDKQLSLPEWGVWERNDGTGGGDNASYVDRMADFIEDPDNAVGYQAYFENNNSQGEHRLMTGQFPEAEEVYRERFGG